MPTAKKPKKKKARKAKKVEKQPDIPSAGDWRTTDEQEVNRRKLRGQEESFSITNLAPGHPVHSTFSVDSKSGLTYQVEIRDARDSAFACTCPDFRTNGLGTCKHVEAVLHLTRRRFRKDFKAATQTGPETAWVELDAPTQGLRLRDPQGKASAGVRKLFGPEGKLDGTTPEDALGTISKSIQRGAKVCVSQEIQPWLENRCRTAERIQLRREYEQKVQSGEWPAHETAVPLYPYQREGMLHLAFTERALLADEMGLGKTIQAIAACALLHRLGQAQRALIVTPASLKTEWEEQIQKFTTLAYRIVFGLRKERLGQYQSPPFFTIVNYEQMIKDSLEVNERLRPDIIVLDEAQRIKNWETKTAQAIKRLQSRYAFVLTGTPIENRIDELYSIMDFLNPAIFGPLFRFNREFYKLDEKGRPGGFNNLKNIHDRISPYMKRRRKHDVETELPSRTVHNRFVKLTNNQSREYEDHNYTASRLLHAAKTRPLRKEEMELLQLKLSCMRMTCDTNYILLKDDRTCPKLHELESILGDAVANDAKVIVFSEWERMLQLCRDLCKEMRIGYAWHTGKVPQKKRRGEINAFKTDPKCRVFLSTDSGSTGLNLQNASIVVNCDLPWNPAKLEQRIARAWRKHQTQAVTFYNLISKETIEEGMLGKLANKQALADGVLDNLGDIENIELGGGRQTFLNKLGQLLTPDAKTVAPRLPDPEPLPVDRPLAFGQRLRDRLDTDLLRCEERYPAEGNHSVLFVVTDNAPRHRATIEALHKELFTGENADRASPVQLEILDKGTADALARLEAAGLVAATFRSSRPLAEEPTEEPPSPPPLTEAEQAAIQEAQEQAARRLKMATVLASADLMEEARPPLLEAIQLLGKALAIENRLPGPTSLEETLAAPVSRTFGDALPAIRDFVGDESAEPAKALETLGGLTQ